MWTREYYGSIDELFKQKESYLKFSDFQRTNDGQVTSADGASVDLNHQMPKKHEHLLDPYLINSDYVDNDE